MKGHSKGYKIVRLQVDDDGTLYWYSMAAGYTTDHYGLRLNLICMTGHKTEYLVGEPTRPMRNCGPLSVIDWCHHWSAFNLRNSGFIFKVEYLPCNKYHHLWSPYGVDYRNHNIHYPGTTYANEVILLPPKPIVDLREFCSECGLRWNSSTLCQSFDCSYIHFCTSCHNCSNIDIYGGYANDPAVQRCLSRAS